MIGMSIQSIATSDFQGLNELKTQAKNNAKEALPEVAKQFEGIFLQSMLKSMRMGQHFLDESSPFSGKNEATFQEMLDAQYASTIAESKGIGLAALLAKQLENSVGDKANNPVNSSNEVNNTKGINSEKSLSVDDFVKSIWPTAKQAASLIGLDPKLLVAQAALETGWGKFVTRDADGSSSNNLFNIKTGSNSKADSIQVKTTEYIADTPIKINASFRKYPSIEHGFHDYVSLIRGSERYQMALANAANPELYVSELNKAGYATDPNYSNKILSIYHGDELNQAIQRCELSEQT
ncbi:TPA: flagellar assembly peptidoglycan hydrolase FlgJ [Legionella pneumophila]|nr:flagellar assembly peptidoglycan hydrolase FlgJ [Legionella pneumophila]RYW31214.1 flagellar assembly peptidoglycan hydrolase FlgJ [Legionella pneumophila]HAT6363241.1 flagellar assembly peptidoglycan hydrolase FlgJ [Legionella pneumophila]HAT6365696.1 flagellar assembly peptidoglycan hydrolase FlgJ [Legionella pneumophila]HAT6369444.1 flagellar assembly peptidoglycan hydrolase FlgJ [Legionella pneumophila]